MAKSITPVILCGGAGSRLWPLSTGARPKPFHAIDGDETLFQATVRRLAPGPDVAFLAPIIVCSAAHLDLVRSQMRAIGVRAARIVVEAEGRGTAVAATVAARAVAELEPRSLMLLAPADHRVGDDESFRAAVAAAGDAAAHRIVLFAAPPDRPETGYGYIQLGPRRDDGLRDIDRFVEKPSRPRAEAMIAEGDWMWNAGLFLAAPELMSAEVSRHAPDVAEEARAAWAGRERRGNVARLASPPPSPAPPSLDTAVIEKSRRTAAAPCAVRWTDVGCWRSLWRASERDDAQNRLEGPATVVDSSGCLVWSSTVPVAVIGMTDVVVVTTADGVLVMPKDRAQEVGRLGLGG